VWQSLWTKRFDATVGEGGTLRDTSRVRPSADYWAVRLDWPAGDHEFGCPRADETAARRELERVRHFWRRGPMRPRLRLARISAHDFDLHAKARRGCKAPDCP
jgi:hypothetical protein